MHYLIGFIITFLTASSFAVLFRMPRKHFTNSVLIGCLTIYGLKLLSLYINTIYSTFIVSFLIGSLGNIFAHYTGKPAQSFIIPSIIFLVPGVHIYKCVEFALSKNYDPIANHLTIAITTTVSISFAILLASWLVPTKKIL